MVWPPAPCGGLVRAWRTLSVGPAYRVGSYRARLAQRRTAPVHLVWPYSVPAQHGPPGPRMPLFRLPVGRPRALSMGP